MAVRVLYIRGLNTYGDDLLHLGPLTLGLMHEQIVYGLTARGWTCHSALGLGPGSLKTQQQAVWDYLNSLSDWQNPELKWHILGHSTGGLVARSLVHRPGVADRCLSVTTVATPHLGAKMAGRAISIHENHPLWTHGLRLCGYDLQKKLTPFLDLRPESLLLFNRNFPDLPPVKYASILCELPLREMCWPLKWLMRWFHPQHRGDGLVDYVSQPWGQTLGAFALDHLQQLGYTPGLNRSLKRVKMAEFNRMLDTLDSYWRNPTKGS